MKKLVKLCILACVFGFLVGCGSSGGGGSGGGGSDTTDKQAYEELDGYYASVKGDVSSADFEYRIDRKKYYPVSQANKDNFVQSIIRKGFTNSSSDNYTATTLPTNISGAKVAISENGTAYSIDLSIQSPTDKAVDDTLFGQTFGTVEGNLSDGGFAVIFTTGSATSDIAQAINASLVASNFTATQIGNNTWKYFLHTDAYNYYILYFYNISSQQIEMDFYFEKLTSDGDDDENDLDKIGLLSPNTFEYFPTINGTGNPYKMVHTVTLDFSKNHENAYTFVHRLLEEKGFSTTIAGWTHYPFELSNYEHITDIYACCYNGNGDNSVQYEYHANATVFATRALLNDLFLPSNGTVKYIETYNKYAGNLTLPLRAYGKILEDVHNFTKFSEVDDIWDKKVGSCITYKWYFRMDSNTESTVGWEIRDICPR